jgi:hypothetical protein
MQRDSVPIISRHIPTEQAIEEFIKETQEERSVRKQTLLRNSQSELQKPASLSSLSSIDIRMLEGSILPKKPVSLKREELNELLLDPQFLVSRLRNSANRIKSYTKLFFRKSNFLLKILSDLMNNYRQEIMLKRDLHSQMWLLMKPFIDILRESQNFKEKIDPVVRNTFYRQQSMEIMVDDELSSLVDKALCNFGLNKNKREYRTTAGDEKEIELKLKNEATRKEMEHLFAMISYRHNGILIQLDMFQIELVIRIDKILDEKNFTNVIEEVSCLSKKFTTEFSNLIRKLETSSYPYQLDAIKCLAKANSLTIMEFELCQKMKKFRKYLDESILSKLYEINKELETKVSEHYDYLRKNLTEFNQMGSKLFNEWNDEHFKEVILDNFVNSCFGSGFANAINLCNLLSPLYKLFMRKQLGMLPIHRIINEDIVDFFRFYQIRFNSESMLIACYMICGKYDAELDGERMVMLCVDVREICIFLKNLRQKLILFRFLENC